MRGPGFLGGAADGIRRTTAVLAGCLLLWGPVSATASPSPESTRLPETELIPDSAPHPMTRQVESLARAARPSLVHVIRAEEWGDREPSRLVGTGISLGGGRFVTSAGVVGASREVLVASIEGDTLVAEVAGVDRRTNLAVVLAPGLSLPALPVTSQAFILPGEWVVAVGLGSATTPHATFGTVVVPKGPSLEYSEVEMIQSTCPVFRGYTGGALLNASGELVGLLSGVIELDADQVYLPEGRDLMAGILHRGNLITITPSAATVAMAAPGFLDLADQLIEHGFVERGYLGLQVELTAVPHPGSARPSRGVLVHQVVEGAPAARAGVLPGDFITDFAGVRVQSPEELSFLVTSRRPGTRVPIKYLRRGHRRSGVIVMDQAPPLPWEPELDASLAGRESEFGANPRAR